MNGYIWLFIVSRCLVYLCLIVRLVAVSIFPVIEPMPCLYVFCLSLVAVSICPVIKQMPCLSVFGCQVAFLAFVQLPSRCLVYLYLLVRLVAVSICPVFKHMPCLLARLVAVRLCAVFNGYIWLLYWSFMPCLFQSFTIWCSLCASRNCVARIHQYQFEWLYLVPAVPGVVNTCPLFQFYTFIQCDV